MPTVSSYTQVVARLMANLPAAVPAGVQVMRGMQAKRMANDNILIGGIEKGSQTFPVSRSGRKPRDEQYDLIMNIVTRRPGNSDPTECETAALTLLNAVGNYMANDVTLDTGYTTLRCEIGEFEMDTFTEDPAGWRTLLVVKVTIYCRLT